MTILTKYLARVLLKNFSIVLVITMSMDFIIIALRELKYLGQGDYHPIILLQYLFFNLPQRLNAMLPWAAFIGALLGLGQLKHSQEIVILELNSFSKIKMSKIVLLVFLPIVMLAEINSEFVLPNAEMQAKYLRHNALNQGQTWQNEYGLWLKYNKEFVHIQKVKQSSHLLGVTRYVFNPDQSLQLIYFAKEAIEHDEGWVFKDCTIKHYFNNQIKTEILSQSTARKFIDSKVFALYKVKNLERSSFNSLIKNLMFFKQQGMLEQNYLQAFWFKIFKPLTLLAMILLSVPLVMGQFSRAKSMNFIIVGMAVVMLVNFVVQMLGNILSQYGVWVPINASLACLAYLGIGLALHLKPN